MKTSTKYFIIVLSIVAIILAGVIGWGIYKIKRNEAETNNLLSQVDQKMRDDLLIQNLHNVKASAEDEIASFERAVLKVGDYAPLIDSIETKAQSLGLHVEITSVDKVETKSKEEPDKIKLVIQTDGSWNGNNNFLHAIESLPYRVMISDIQISKNEQNWHSVITLNLYTF